MNPIVQAQVDAAIASLKKSETPVEEPLGAGIVIETVPQGDVIQYSIKVIKAPEGVKEPKVEGGLDGGPRL